MDFSKDTDNTFSQQGNTWNQNRGGRGGGRGGGGRGGWTNQNYGQTQNQNYGQTQNQTYGQTQNYNQTQQQQQQQQPSYQSNQPQQWAPPAGAPAQNQPPPSWAPPQQQQQQQQPPVAAPPAAPAGPPKIFVRADGCDAFLDLRVILPSDRFPNINWGGRVIGSKGATIKMLQNDHNVKILINDGNNGKDPTYQPSSDPPHVRVQASGPLGDVLRRMAAVADEFSTRFDPYWKDPLLEKQRAEQNAEANGTTEPKANGEQTGEFTTDTPPAKDGEEANSSASPAKRGGFVNRGRGRGGRGSRGDFGNRGGRGSFRGRGGMRGGYNQGGNNFQQGGPMRNQNQSFQQTHNPY